MIYASGFTREGQRIWPFISWHSDNLNMRMIYMKKNAYRIGVETGYTERYIKRLVDQTRQNPSAKVLTAMGRALKCFWFQQYSEAPAQNPAVPGYDSHGNQVWPMLEFTSENMNMRMQYVGLTNFYHLAEETEMPEERLKRLSAGAERPNMDELSDIGLALRCIFVFV